MHHVTREKPKVLTGQARTGLADADVYRSNHLNSVDVLVHIVQQQGRYEAASAMPMMTLRHKEARLGPKHHYTLTNINSITNILIIKESLKRQKVYLDEPKMGWRRFWGHNILNR